MPLKLERQAKIGNHGLSEKSHKWDKLERRLRGHAVTGRSPGHCGTYTSSSLARFPLSMLENNLLVLLAGGGERTHFLTEALFLTRPAFRRK